MSGKTIKTFLASGNASTTSRPASQNRPLKIALGGGLAAWLIAVAALTYLDVIAHRIVLSDLRNYLARTALATAALIDENHFLQFTHREQEATPQYREATRPLAVLLETNPDIHFAYAGVTTGDRMHFVLDGTPLTERNAAGQWQHAAPTDEDKASPGEIEVTRTEKVTVEATPSATAWGMGIRAQAPIFSHNGTMVGYVGLTMRATRYSELVHRTDIATVGGALFAALLAVLSGFAILRIEQERETAARARDAAEIKLADERDRIRDYAQALDHAEESHRRSIAKTLHEDLQQTLTGLSLMLASARDHPRRDHLPELSSNALEAVRDGQAAIKALIQDLAPPELEQASLAQIMGWVATLFDTRYGLKTTWSIEGEADLSPDLRRLMYRMVREVIEYAHARTNTQADVKITSSHEQVQLQITTSGTHSDVPRLATTDIPIELRRIDERTRASGGKFELVFLPHGGCWAAVSIPRG